MLGPFEMNGLLQTQVPPPRDSEELVAPRCLPGYVDVTGGEAYYWSCAFHCEGGAYYATTGCMCACLTPDQLERLPSQGSGGSFPAPGKIQSGKVLITPSTVAPPAAGDPVLEIPVGALGEDRRSGPPAVDSYVAPKQDAPTLQDAEDQAEEEKGVSFVVIALIGGTILVIAAATTLVCALWSTLADAKRRRRVKFVAAPPRFSPQVPVERCPQPLVDPRTLPAANVKVAVSLQEPVMRASWTSSAASSNFKSDVWPPQPSLQPQLQPQLQSHLQLPDSDRMLKGSPNLSKVSTCSGGGSATSSISSNSWATKREPRDQGRAGQARRASQATAKGGFGIQKASRVCPEQAFAGPQQVSA